MQFCLTLISEINWVFLLILEDVESIPDTFEIGHEVLRVQVGTVFVLLQVGLQTVLPVLRLHLNSLER